MADSCDDESNGAGDSELGKKEYWDAIYKQELSNLQQLGDEGELW